MRDDEITTTLSRGLAQAGHELQRERIRQTSVSTLRTRNHDGDGGRGDGGSRRHIAAKRVIVLTRQLPQQLLGLLVDRRTVVQGTRHRRDRHAGQPCEIFQTCIAPCGHDSPLEQARDSTVPDKICAPIFHFFSSGRSWVNPIDHLFSESFQTLLLTSEPRFPKKCQLRVAIASFFSRPEKIPRLSRQRGFGHHRRLGVAAGGSTS